MKSAPKPGVVTFSSYSAAPNASEYKAASMCRGLIEADVGYCCVCVLYPGLVSVYTV